MQTFSWLEIYLELEMKVFSPKLLHFYPVCDSFCLQ